MDRTTCPMCGDDTEFVQFGGEASTTTVVSEDAVSDGLLELRTCPDCGAAIENVLTVDYQVRYE